MIAEKQSRRKGLGSAVVFSYYLKLICRMRRIVSNLGNLKRFFLHEPIFMAGQVRNSVQVNVKKLEIAFQNPARRSFFGRFLVICNGF